jgi:NADH-quinone oxidoreductase subunit M
MMQSTFPFLSLAIWCPIAFGLLVFDALGRDRQSFATGAQSVSLVGSIISLPGYLAVDGQQFDNAAHGMQFVEKRAMWIERFNINYFLGIDGISLWFIPIDRIHHE